MPLPDYLNQFDKSLLNSETFDQFKTALLKEYNNDVDVLNHKVSQAEGGATEKLTALEAENMRLKAANWDMWQRIPGDSATQNTFTPPPEAEEEPDAPSLDSFFK